jgi:hypothetical protein
MAWGILSNVHLVSEMRKVYVDMEFRTFVVGQAPADINIRTGGEHYTSNYYVTKIK